MSDCEECDTVDCDLCGNAIAEGEPYQSNDAGDFHPSCLEGYHMKAAADALVAYWNGHRDLPVGELHRAFRGDTTDQLAEAGDEARDRERGK